ncbi:MAG: SMC-Scp complex subunit ScpB [Desulfobacterales bacterium]|nr:SMC-Scp complex subunit ScpB [Desulfobacterales bacterium]
MDNLKAIVEGLLFASDTPLTTDKIKSVLEIADRKDIREALASLAEEYESNKRGFFLAEVAGGFQLRTRPEYRQWIRRLKETKPARLSRAALETLAIIAYKQPVLRSDLEHLRGVDCGGTLRTLLERKLIRLLGRKDLPGRPIIYGTTKEFLEFFDLKDLKDLPTLKDLKDMGEACLSDSK